MAAIMDEVDRLVPPHEGWPLVGGLLVGALVGATIAGLVVVGLTIQSRRAARRSRPGASPSTPPFGAEPSPL